MKVARSVAEILSQHTTLALECIDRLYLNVYVPVLQRAAGAAYFFREVRGASVPSSALMAPMTQRFVDAIKRFAERDGIDIVSFRRGERKDERTQEYLRQWPGGEGVLYIGKAQEKARVLRTERRRRPSTGATYAWLVDSTAMVNHFYFYVFDDDFGPFFLKFCSYFPYNAKMCINGHEYLKRQLAKRGIGFEPLDNGILRCANPAAMQRLADRLTAARVDALLRKWAGPAAAPVLVQRPGAGHPLRHLDAASRIRPHRGFRPAACRTGLLRRGDAREPRHGATRPRAVDLRPTRQPTHPHAASHPRDYRRGRPVAACGRRPVHWDPDNRPHTALHLASEHPACRSIAGSEQSSGRPPRERTSY